jgi:hypothetical protein
MAVAAYVGSFALDTSTGSQSVTPAGLTFTPKAALFFGNHLTADTTADDAVWFMGAAVSGTDEIATGFQSTNNLTTLSACRVYLNLDRSIQLDLGAGIDCTADTTSLDAAPGFTINITNAPSSAFLVNYILLGGDVTGAQTFLHNLGSGAGNKSNSTLSGTPAAVLFFTSVGTQSDAVNDLSSNVTAMLGWMCADGTQGYCMTRHAHGSAISNTLKRQRTNKCFGLFSDTTEFAEGHFVSMDATGYTVNLANAPSVTALRIHGIAFYGGTWTAVAFNSSTTTGQTAVATPGVNPALVMLQTFGTTATTASVAGGGRGMGAASSSTRRAALAYQDLDGADTTAAESALDRTKFLIRLSNLSPPTSIPDAYAPVDFTVESFTYDHTVASGTAVQIISVVVGNPPAVGPGPDTPELIPARMAVAVP